MGDNNVRISSQAYERLQDITGSTGDSLKDAASNAILRVPLHPISIWRFPLRLLYLVLLGVALGFIIGLFVGGGLS